LTGKLDRAGQQEFEAHYLKCPKCLQKLQVSRLLQEQLWDQSERILPQTQKPQRVRTRRREWAISVAIMVLVIAAAALWWQFRGPGRRPDGTKETPPSLIMLARFEPPSYIPPALRGAEDEAAERFLIGMKLYMEGRYGEAIPGLRAAAGLNPKRASIRFFLGICLLLTEQTDAGIEELKKAVDLSDSTYLEEAHFYMAKAFLAKGDGSRAEEELTWVLKRGSRLKEEAAQILSQLR
jgi:tetratricopeptide (TPR) repeat protein